MKFSVTALTPLLAFTFYLAVGIPRLMAAPNISAEGGKVAPAKDSAYRLPAEFEHQSGVWLFWPQVQHRKDMKNENVVVNLIKEISAYTHVHLGYLDDAALIAAKALIPNDYEAPAKMTFHQVPYQEFWSRDMGPIFLVDSMGKPAMADFSFTDWGYGDLTMEDVKLDEKVDEFLAAKFGMPVISSPIVSEGGDHEVNGKGTMILCETVQLQRNPGSTKASIEAEFTRVFGIKKFIWMKEGLYEDEHTFDGPLVGPEGKPVYTVFTTNGHVDEYVRWVNPSTVLLAEVPVEDRNDAIGKVNHARMETNLQILNAARDQDGKPINVIRIPLPKAIIQPMTAGDPIYDLISEMEFLDGSKFPKKKPILTIAAASYNNFLITNGAVICQKYYQEGGDPAVLARDSQVRNILEKAFPGRKIIMMDAMAINWGGGGIHCITRQQPQY